MISIQMAVIYILFAPLIGAVIVGIDRKITARMQGRVGPPVLQPLYDIFKLFEKENIIVTISQNFYVFSYLTFIIFTGALFFAGGDLLLVIFALTLAHIFLVLGAYSSYSPFSHIGAGRELIQIMAVEPMIILVAVGMYQVTGSFAVSGILEYPNLIIQYLPGVFVGLVYILTLKLRKSPFDLSTSHHAHQELVKGVTTEFSGPTLGMEELAHLYETIFLLGLIYIFFSSQPVIGILVAVVVYLLEIFVDNATSRVKWQFALMSCWIITATFGVLNLLALYLL